MSGEIAGIVSDVVKDAKKVIKEVKRVGDCLKEETRGKIKKLTDELKDHFSIVEKVIE